MIGLIGRKLGHSYSKRIHELIGGYDYELIELEPEDLDSFMTSGRFVGLNVTIPYKESVIAYCAELSEAAGSIGSVNTIIRRPDGSLFGHNTDYDGLKALIVRSGIGLDGAKVAILGSGGTSKTARKVCTDLGSSEVVVVSRTGNVNYDNLPDDYDVLINATPVGMYPNAGAAPVNVSEGCKGVVDVIYNPLRTELVMEAGEMGIACTGGLYMLAAQAVAASRLFSAALADAEQIYIKLLREKLNIVLIGMPGSGKSVLGKVLSDLSGRPLVDIDSIIESKAGMTIAEIFSRHGELYFRALESEVIASYGAETGHIISTGGGAPMSEKNRRSLLQNGRIYLVERELEQLSTGGRPLSKDIGALRNMYAERASVYRDFCDVSVENNKEIEALAIDIWEDFNENIGC